MELVDIIENRLQELGYKLVDFKIKSGKTLKYEITIYSDAGITHEDCKLVTNSIMNDESIDSILGEDYILEVSSPGLGRRLKSLREFSVFIDKEIDYCILNSTPSVGIIRKVDKNKIVIFDKNSNLEKEFSLEEIQYAKLKDIGG